MADSDGSDIQPIGPREKKMYEQEYRHGAELFKQAAQQYSKSDNPFQQAEFKDVMDKAMQVMNETARELMRQELMNQNSKIAQDYEEFQKMPSDSRIQQQLTNDLDKAKKSIH